VRQGNWGAWSLGLILAVMIPVAELIVGFQRRKSRDAGRATAELTLLMLGLALTQSAYTYLSEQAGVYKTAVDATQVATSKPTQCAKDVMPGSYVGHPDSIKAWTAQHQDPEGDYERCRVFEKRANREDATDQTTVAARHLWWEKWLQSSTAGLLSLVIGNCSEAVNDLLLALLALFPWPAPKEAAPEEPSKPAPPKGRRARFTWPKWLMPGAPAEDMPLPAMARQIAED
jgi:hypothetical protein